MVTPPAAASSENCTCDEARGYERGNASACVRKAQFVSTQEAQAAAVTVSNLVVSVTVANVAVAVATSVAGAVGGVVGGGMGGAGAGLATAEAGAAGGAAAESSSTVQVSTSGTMNLISQVQYLNVLGRVGGPGANTSESLQAFADGFGWGLSVFAMLVRA